MYSHASIGYTTTYITYKNNVRSYCMYFTEDYNEDDATELHG